MQKLTVGSEWYECLYKDKYSGEIYLELTFYSNVSPSAKDYSLNNAQSFCNFVR